MLRRVPEKMAVLALGGNVGDVEKAFAQALDALLEEGMKPVALSSLYLTKPEGCEPGASDFLNAVSLGTWDGDAHSLLKLCQKLEAKAGRPANHPHWVSRPLDIDIIAFGPDSLSEKDLTLPHPLVSKRYFALAPLAEIAPEIALPGFKENAASLLAALNLENRQHIVTQIRKWGALQWTSKLNSGLD